MHVLRNELINLIALISNPGREMHAGISIIIILIQYDLWVDGRDLDAEFNYVVRWLLQEIIPRDLDFILQISVVVNLCICGRIPDKYRMAGNDGDELENVLKRSMVH